MTTYFVIRLGGTADQPVSWIAVDDKGTRRDHPGTGTLEDAARQVRERPVIALVPGIEVVSLNAEVPARGARLLAALPYALEDQLADDIENLHFAAGTRRDDGTTPVAVVARSAMAGWVAQLEAAGIAATRIVPENHGLAYTPNTLSMVVTDDSVMFNDGENVEFVVPGLRPSEALAATGIIGGEDDDASRHLLVYCDAGIGDEYEKDWALLRHELDSVDVHLLPDGVLPRLAVTVASGAGIDLLQGRFGARTDLSAAFRPWRFAAMFLIGLFVIGIGGKAADYYRLSVEQSELREQFADVYQSIRPGATRDIVDPRGIVMSLGRNDGLPTAAGPQVFLPSLEQLALALQQSDAVSVEAISYRAGVIDVRLTAPDVPTLDGIVQTISASGQFTASLQSADSVGDRVNSRIQIRETGA